MQAIAHFPSVELLTRHAPVTPVPGRPDLLAHQAPDVFKLWHAWEAESDEKQDIPYWATVWPAARMLAKFFASEKRFVAGRGVLDFGCGGGLAGIAALKAGARHVLANDIDPVALEMVKLNAAANGVTIDTLEKNLLEEFLPAEIQTIVVGDLFYEKSVSEKMLRWLAEARRSGVEVLIADASRPFGPTKDVEVLAQEKYATDPDLEGTGERLVRLMVFQPEWKKP